jgi:hypothetical protein
MAKNYIDNLSEETRKGCLKRRARDLALLRAARLSERDGGDGKRTIAPNPELAPVIQRMFERYATGKHSLKELANWRGRTVCNIQEQAPGADLHRPQDPAQPHLLGRFRF